MGLCYRQEGQPRGKQVSRPEGIWYTPVTGIWQTVWMEPVESMHIEQLRITPDIDRNQLTVRAGLSTFSPSSIVEIKVFDGGRQVASGKSLGSESVEIDMPENVRLWSPESPTLYQLEVTLENDGKTVDSVNSYAAIRKHNFTLKPQNLNIISSLPI